jgi:hypothetical protein
MRLSTDLNALWQTLTATLLLTLTGIVLQVWLEINWNFKAFDLVHRHISCL